MPRATSYQFFHPLPGQMYEALKASIAEHGVLQPIVVDENGVVLDGHHRKRACAELHVGCPSIVKDDLEGDAEKEAYVISTNALRRQLSGVERSQAIARLKVLGWSSRRIGEALGVNHSTIVRSGGADAPPDTPTPQKGSVDDGPASEGLAPSPVETTPSEPSETAVGQRSASHRKDARPGSETDPATTGEPGEGEQVPAPSSAPRVQGADGKSYPAKKAKQEKKPLDSMGRRHAFNKVSSSFHDTLAYVDWDELVAAYAEGDEIDKGHLPAFASSLRRWAGLIEDALKPTLRSV